MAKEERGIQKNRSFHFRKMFDINPVRQAYNYVHENGNGREATDEKVQIKNEDVAEPALLVSEHIDTVLDNKGPVSPPLTEEVAASGPAKKEKQPSGFHHHIAFLYIFILSLRINMCFRDCCYMFVAGFYNFTIRNIYYNCISFMSILLLGLDMELMKERFSKLLLGEDMSGGGKGVSSALALSNAITNLAGKPE